MRPLSVPVRQLGKDGVPVSALGFGAVSVLSVSFSEVFKCMQLMMESSS